MPLICRTHSLKYSRKTTSSIVIICTLPRFYLLAEECIDGKGICKSKLAYGQGYEKLTADRIEYKISSPNKLAKIPTDFAGSGSIHVEIPNDASMSYKIIEISFSSPIGKCKTCLKKGQLLNTGPLLRFFFLAFT